MKRLLGIMVLFIGVQSQAGVLIEPYVGMGNLTYGTEDKDSATYNREAAGTNSVLGARLGGKFMGFWAAADYMMNSGTVKFDKPKGQPDLTTSLNMLFLDVGYDIPFGLRLWAGYGLSQTFTIKGTVNFETFGEMPYEEKWTGGSATKFGVGFSFLHFLSVNLEYIQPKFKKASFIVNGESAGDSDLDESYKSTDLSLYQLTLSFPFNLP